MPQRRVETQFYGAKAVPIARRKDEPEYKPDPEEQHRLNLQALERFRAGRRSRGVVDDPPAKVPRIR